MWKNDYERQLCIVVYDQQFCILADYDKPPENTEQRLAAHKLSIPQSILNKLLKSRDEASAPNRKVET